MLYPQRCPLVETLECVDHHTFTSLITSVNYKPKVRPAQLQRRLRNCACSGRSEQTLFLFEPTLLQKDALRWQRAEVERCR